MKTRLLSLSLLCLICLVLNAQSRINGLMKHHRMHRNEQKEAGTAVKSFGSCLKPAESVFIRNVVSKYYPPKVNREYVYFNEDGTTTLRYRMYYECDQWGNALLEERGNDYRTVQTYSEKTQGKLQLSESYTRWNGVEWVEDRLEEAFETQLDAEGIRIGVTGRYVQESSFNEKGYLIRLLETDGKGSSSEDRSSVEIQWNNDFPASLELLSYGDSISLTNVVLKYEIDKFNPYLSFSDDWADFFFDSDGSNFVLFNANIYWSSDENEDGIPDIMRGRVISEFKEETKTYTRSIYASVNEKEIPVIIETKTYLDSNGSFQYRYSEALENWSYVVTRTFNEYGDVIRDEDSEIDGEYTYTSVETYNREYDEKGYPVKVTCTIENGNNNRGEGYIETYGEKTVPDTSLEVEVSRAGTLREVVQTAFEEYYDLIRLKVTGPLNEEDLRFIRNDLYRLQILDLGTANLSYLFNGALQSSQLVSLILPGDLKYIENGALAYSQELKTVELPASLNFLGEGVFNQCNKLETIICRMVAPLNLDVNPFAEMDKNLCKLKVPALAAEAYRKSKYWNEFSAIEGVEDLEIGESVILNGSLQLGDKWFNRFTNLTLGYGAGLTVDGGKDFSLKSLVLYQGDVRMREPLYYNLYGDLRSGRQIAPSSLINKCENMTSEEVKVEYICQQGIWYFVSFPFDVNRNDITVEKLDTTDIARPEFVLRYYDGANRATAGVGQSWKDVTETTLKAGCGYIFQASREVRLIVKGNASGAIRMLTPFEKEIAVNENLSEMTSNQGWNLIGNPYPSYYDMNGMDFKAPVTVWNPNKYTYEAYSVLDADNYMFFPMQAFFVQVPSGTSRIRFAPEARSTGMSYIRMSSLRSAETGRRLINLLLSDGTYSDKSRIAISSQASSRYDMQEDAAKFMSPVTSVPQLYTLDTDYVRYAINALPLTEGESVEVGYYAGKSGEFVLSVERADTEVWLYDALTDVTQELSAEGYHFTTEQGSYDHRFRLYIGIRPTSIQSESQETFEVLSVKGGLLIKGLTGQPVEVYSVAGMKVAGVEFNGQDTFVSLASGAYLIKVGDSVCKSVVY